MAPERKRSARDYEQALRRQELAAGRALTQALFDLRRLGRDLDQEIEGLRAKGSRPTRAAQGSGPGELDRIEAVRSAVEELAERWEGRREQLGAELDRRQPRGARDRGEVSGRRGAAPARPARPRSRPSRRSPG